MGDQVTPAVTESVVRRTVSAVFAHLTDRTGVMMVVLTTADPPMSKLGAPTPIPLPQSTTVEGCISLTLAMAPSPPTPPPTAHRLYRQR